MKLQHKILKNMRTAFTLVEMLIAMALTLILVYAIAEFYAYIGNAVRDGRATIEMGGQLRAAAQQLNDDLQSLTLHPTPWIDPARSPGGFTVYEGPYSDTYPDSGTNDITLDTDANNVPDLVQNLSTTNLVGDGDDLIWMTIRAKDVPFQGLVWDPMQSLYVSVSSLYAEVIWFTTFTDLDSDGIWDINEPRFLCRKQLLIAPLLTNSSPPILPGVTLPMKSNAAEFMQNSEVSFHFNSSGQPIANSLADLSVRTNRFGCQGNYPSHQRLNPTSQSSLQAFSFSNEKFGEDRVLANLLAFDVRVYDPAAPILQDASGVTALVPGDTGYRTIASSGSPTPIGYGAYVDLNFNRTGMAGSSYFSGPPTSVFVLAAPAPGASPYNFVFWDTWSTTYETFGPGNGQAFNGLDDDGNYGVDDPGERQTQPPYVVPLRGIQVRIRMYEPQTRQMRQVTIGADFIPN